MASVCPLTVIGVVRSDRHRAEQTPVQSALNPDEQATVEVLPPFVDGLAGLDGFDHFWLVTWLDQASRDEGMRQVPFLLRPTGQSMGVFATRSPNRINPLGLSVVRLVGIDSPVVRFAGVDLLDGTPVVDIKPYVGRFDRPDGEPRSGWYDTVSIASGVRPADLGPVPPGAGGSGLG